MGAAVEITNVTAEIPGYGCHGLDLSLDGRWYTSCQDNEGNVYVGWVDPVTGDYTALDWYNSDFYITEFATDPITGTIWAFVSERDEAFFALDILDPETGSLFSTQTLDKRVWGADFDRDGTLFVTSWFSDGEGVDYAELNTLTVGDGVFTVIDVVTDEGVALEDDRMPLTVWGRVPALPVTGAGDALPVGFGAALLLLAGAAFVVMRRSSALHVG